MTTVCEVYDYKLEYFYQRSFKEGGVTFGQLFVLFEHAQKREAERYRLQAMMHGAEAKDAPQSVAQSEIKVSKPFMFGDPDEYKNMSAEEQKDLTEKMMGMHKQWASKPIHPRGKVRFKNG